MALKDQLMNDFKEAMKAHDDLAKNTISFARAAVKQVEVDTRKELEDSDVIAILAKQVKMRKDALADFEKAGREDLIDSYKSEIEILERYLPEKLSPEKISEEIAKIAAELGLEKGAGAQNMGKLMGPCMAKLKGLADGGDVKSLVQKFLK